MLSLGRLSVLRIGNAHRSSLIIYIELVPKLPYLIEAFKTICQLGKQPRGC